ncbi:hypothetical protein Tco_0564031 [Tanacetum coccineum]
MAGLDEEAIKSRFGGNDESKKMQKYILKQQFEASLYQTKKGLIMALKVYLPSAWSQVSLIMRTKPGVDSLSFDDLYNNLKVFESDVKGSTTSSSSNQNVAFVFENTSSTNEVSTGYGVSNSSDLEEMDLKWQVAMISMRMKKFYKKTGRKLQFDAKEPGNQDSRMRDAWNTGNKDKDNGRSSGKQEESKALVTLDGEGSNTEVTSCSKECKESYAKIKKLYDEQREEPGDASIEIHAYTQSLKKVEAQLVAHQQNQLWSSDFTCESNSSKETHESMPESVVNEPKVVSQPKSWTDAPIIEEYESDSNDEHVSLPSKEQETPSFANTIKHVKTLRQTVKQQNTCSKSPKPDKKDCSGLMSKKLGLGYGFTKKAFSAVGGKWETVVKPLVDVPHKALENKGIVDSRCSRYMTGNKAYLVDYQDYNGGPVAFGGSKGFITAALKSCPKHNMIAYLEKTDGNVEYITATVAGKPVTILEASIRSDLLFDDADGIDTLNNQAIFDTIQLMGHLDAKKKFVMYPRFISVFLATQLKNVPVPLDHFPINAMTSKVLSFMVKKGKIFLGNVTPLFDSMLVQPTEDEGEALERPFESQPIPSPPYLSENQPESQPDPSIQPSPSIPIPDSNPEGSGGNHGGQSSSDRSLSGNKGWPVHYIVGRKTAKSKPTTHKDQAFDDPDDFGPIDYMETEDAHNEKGVSIEDQVNTVKPDKGIDKPKVSTDKIDEGTAELKNGNSDENATPTATPIVFGDDETIAEFLTRPTSTRSLLTLKPLPKIDPKAKGKGMIEEEDESDTESEDINEAKKKFKMLANDEEIARKVKEEWEAEEEKKRLNADKILAEKLQEEEREKFTIEERAKLLHDTIAAQWRFLAQQRSEVIRNKFPSRTQLRNQMVKRSDENFIAIGSVEDERIIKELNKKAAGIKNADSIKEESKEEEGTKKRKLGTRKKMNSRKRRFRKDTSEDDETNSEKENDELRLCLSIVSDEDKEVDYEILDKKYPIIEWKSKYLGIKPQYDKTKDLEEINLNVVIRSNGQRRYFSTLMRVLSIFDRDYLNVVYQLVMDRYQDDIPEGFDRTSELLVLEQTASGKDFSNPFMVDNLPKNVVDSFLKTIWLSVHHVMNWLSKATATGKEISNSLNGCNLPKLQKPNLVDVAMLLRRYVSDKKG